MKSLNELNTLKNIGQELERKLKLIGITTSEELIDTGSKETFDMLKAKFPNICLVHLYSLEGAILGIEYNQSPSDIKENLKDYCDSFKPKN